MGNSHQPRTLCFPQAITYSLFWFFPGITSNLMLVSPIPWFLYTGRNDLALAERRFNTDTHYYYEYNYYYYM